MVNPSLKAKIEAAKSALEENQNNTPPNQERDDSIAPETVLKPTPESEQTSPGIAEAPTNFESDAATLDARITRLENKLAENQRDLHTLLGKIREVTRFQNDNAKNNGPINTKPKNISSAEQNVNRPQSRKIAITLAVLTGIILGTSFFLASNFIDQHWVHLQSWAIQFVDFISDNVG